MNVFGCARTYDRQKHRNPKFRFLAPYPVHHQGNDEDKPPTRDQIHFQERKFISLQLAKLVNILKTK